MKPRRTKTHWRWRLKRLGLTPEEYDAMLARQGGRCAICGASEPGGKRKGGAWAVDHCHASDAVRGLLCHRCNLALGLFDDSPERLAAAIQYLQPRSEGAAA